MAKAVKKAPAKRAVKKVNPLFERAVKTATWCSVGFCLFDLLWYTLAYGFDAIYTLMMGGLAVLAVLLKAAHDKKNIRIQDGLSSVALAALFILKAVIVVSYEIPEFAGVFGKEIVPTAALVLDVALVGILLVFTIVHFMCAGKDAKRAIVVNRKLNFVILLVSVSLMVVYASMFGTENGVEMVEMLCFYGVVIFVTDLVQRLEEGK